MHANDSEVSNEPSLCPLDSFLKNLRGRWCPSILFALGESGPLRFAELQRAISPDLTAKSLSESLGKLGDAGLIIRTEMPSAAREVIYELSPAGRETHDALKILGGVAQRLAGAA